MSSPSFSGGLINQTTDDNLPRLLMEKPRTIYIGFDPTADSLHIGHLVQLICCDGSSGMDIGPSPWWAGLPA